MKTEKTNTPTFDSLSSVEVTMQGIHGYLCVVKRREGQKRAFLEIFKVIQHNGKPWRDVKSKRPQHVYVPPYYWKPLFGDGTSPGMIHQVIQEYEEQQEKEKKEQ